VEAKLKHKRHGGAAAGLSDIVSRNGPAADVDRGLELGAANVTGPEMVDPAGEIEAWLLGHQ